MWLPGLGLYSKAEYRNSYVHGIMDGDPEILHALGQPPCASQRGNAFYSQDFQLV